MIYDFHYNYIQKKYPNNTKLLFTEIQTEDVYKDFFEDKSLFDNSDYPVNSPFYFLGFGLR